MKYDFFVDAHAHNPSQKHRPYQVISVDIREVVDVGFEPEGPFCIGIHPWYIDELVIDDSYSLIEEMVSHRFCMGIGEAGIDRSIKTSVEEQEKVFVHQIKLAIEHQVPGLMLHCVRAYPDIIRIIKKTNYRGSLIFHDYNGNPDVTTQLLRFNSFFSYGDKLFKEKSAGFKSFTHIPNHRILLESDDMVDKSIEEVYKKASKLLNMDLDKLNMLTLENSEIAFGKGLPL